MSSAAHSVLKGLHASMSNETRDNTRVKEKMDKYCGQQKQLLSSNVNITRVKNTVLDTR
jgi:hypothetical protein